MKSKEFKICNNTWIWFEKLNKVAEVDVGPLFDLGFTPSNCTLIRSNRLWIFASLKHDEIIKLLQLQTT